MKWFEGGIPQAIVSAKAKNALFVVFVAGTDNASNSTAEAIDSVEVSSKLESDDFVAIRLESGSETYRQFAQIYQLVPVPSLFLIGSDGAPLEIVAGEVGAPELSSRIDGALAKAKKVPASQNDVKSETEVNSPKIDSSKSARSIGEVDTGELPSTSSSSDNVKESEAAAKTQNNQINEAVQQLPANPPAELDDKVEHAKELIAKKREIKLEEERKKEKQKELERRKLGQEVQKMKKRQEDQQLKQLVEERQKEKEEEKAARERILQQIAQDRAERAAKYSAEKEAEQKRREEERQRKLAEQQARAVADAAARSDTARIQFRLPDGSSHTQHFDADTTLGVVRTYIQNNLNLPYRNFTLSMTFPRREFPPSEDNKTLRELQLAPSAAVLILPVASSAITSSAGGAAGGLSSFIWSLVTPVLALLNYFRGMLFGAGSGSSGNQAKRRKQDPPAEQGAGASASNDQSGQLHKRRSPTEARFRRDGNIHRLTNRDDSDEENNTWNGNSTQQM